MTRDRGEASRCAVGVACAGAWIIAGGCAAALLGAGAARFVPPDRLWPLQILAIALPAPASVLFVLALLAGLKRRWRLAAFCLAPIGLLLALPLVTSERDVAPMTEHATELASLKVVTFNAKPEAIGEAGTAALQALLAEERPHLVALQEFPLRVFATGEVGVSRLVIPFLKHEAYEVALPRTGGDVDTTRPIFSRIETAGMAALVPDNPRGGIRAGLWASGGLTRGLYRWEGTTIAVYNLHLHSFSGQRPWNEGWRAVLSPDEWATALRAYRADFRTRAEQARAIRRLIDAETRPFLLVGDFNSTPGSWVYAHLSEGLQDAFGRAGTGWGATFPARLPLARIDFVLASAEWEVRRAHVSKTVVSDHIPVVAELALRFSRASRSESQEGDAGGQ